MTRADLIDVLAEQANLTRKEAETFVETIFDRIADALEARRSSFADWAASESDIAARASASIQRPGLGSRFRRSAPYSSGLARHFRTGRGCR